MRRRTNQSLVAARHGEALQARWDRPARVKRRGELGARRGARDLRLSPQRVERVRVGPSEAEPLSTLGPREVAEREPERGVVREGDVALRTVEGGVEVEAVADVAGEQV